MKFLGSSLFGLSSGKTIFSCLVALIFCASAAQAQWFQVRNSGGSGTPGHPAGTIYVGDTGLTFTCDAGGTLEGAWGGSQVWIHTGTDIHNGTAGAATSFTSSDAKSNTSGRFTSAGTWYWGMRIQYNRSGGTTVGWYNRNTANWENAYGTPDANLTVTVTAIPSPTSQTATATSSSNITCLGPARAQARQGIRSFSDPPAAPLQIYLMALLIPLTPTILTWAGDLLIAVFPTAAVLLSVATQA